MGLRRSQNRVNIRNGSLTHNVFSLGVHGLSVFVIFAVFTPILPEGGKGDPMGVDFWRHTGLVTCVRGAQLTTQRNANCSCFDNASTHRRDVGTQERAGQMATR
jgi:hypothetical protein